MISAVRKKAICPDCGRECRRHSKRERSVITTRGREKIKVSIHHCPICRKYFTAENSFAKLRTKYGYDIIEIIQKHTGTLQQIEMYFRKEFGLRIPTTTIHDLRKIDSQGE